VTTPRVSAVVVNHRSAAEAADCVGSLREAFARERVDGEVVLVDCASGPGERPALEALPAEARVFLEENRGYSGGVNAGIARARAPRLFLCNADVVFRADAVSALLQAIEDPAVGAAAPLCLWDAEGRLRLPPESRAGFWGELAERHSGRFRPLDARRFAAFARRSLALWERGGDADHLAGAVLAVRREVLERVGVFDERFLFEYEETEWEDRVRAAGLRLRFVAEARVRHLFARSSSRNPDTERRRAASRRLYREQRYGRLGRALLERPQKGSVGRAAARRVRTLAEPALPARAGAWVAVSTNPSLIPFAGGPLGEEFRLPSDVLASLRPGPVYLRAFARDGRALDTGVWQRP
jgi:N-acetylglucosaminyl-diphospho-decaprenol L-rhamnosyltransferase